MCKIRITNHQIFALTVGLTNGSAILVISASVAGLAKQDSWISMLFTIVFGFLEIWLICFLWNHYPGLTFVEMIRQIFGKWFGSVITIAFLYFCFLSDAQVIWYIGNFITSQAMLETPPYIVNMIFSATIVIALLYGLEAIARSYEIFIYIISFLFVLSMIFVLPNARIENLQPVFEEGLIPVLKGSTLLSSFVIFPFVLLIMIFPAKADNTFKAMKSFVKGYLWGGFLLFTSILISVLVLGSTITANIQYPVFVLAQEINLANIFTRLEFIVAGVWIITVLTKGIFYFYAGLIGLAQLIELKDHKKIILPLGLIIFVMSGVVFPDATYQSAWDSLVWPFFAATFGLILPIVMAAGFYIKKWVFNRHKG
ncbi:endospore germination permease [Iocasia frigidifontis]|uniref:Endospore germination permease n=1 Tax=Iocasia fonsfrigidae TaxID=2682810 RepID=A0A8A7KQJ5_9FIRM|nr:endospore germination permease [Iocasia fonsfrigidae]